MLSQKYTMWFYSYVIKEFEKCTLILLCDKQSKFLMLKIKTSILHDYYLWTSALPHRLPDDLRKQLCRVGFSGIDPCC